MVSRLHPQAERLLAAHVAHVMEQLQGRALESLLADEVDDLLADARRVTLEEVVTRHMIKATARTYAAEIEPPGAIPELIGDIARALYAHPVHGQTRLRDLLPDGLFEEFLDKFLEMEDLHGWVAHEAINNPVYSALATDIVIEGIRGYIYHGSARAGRVPGMRQAGALGAKLLRGTLPAIEETVEESLRAYLQRSISDLLKGSEEFLLGLFDREQVRLLATEAWEAVRDRRVVDFQDGVSSLDIEELFVIAYELWRNLRSTPFYVSMIDAGVDAFFDKYGEATLHEILEEMGITREIALQEGLRFAPHVLDVLRQKGMLEPMVRRRLEGFYASEAVSAILATPGDGAADAPARKPAAAKAAATSVTPAPAPAAKKAAARKAPAKKAAVEKTAEPQPAAAEKPAPATE